MRRKLAPGEKPLFWIGSSKRDLLAMPDPVVRQIGAALSVAQYGGKHPDAEPWKGLGPGVFEVVCNGNRVTPFECSSDRRSERRSEDSMRSRRAIGMSRS